MAVIDIDSDRSAASDFNSPAWDVSPFKGGGSIQVSWSGLDGIDAAIMFEVSNDEIGWNAYRVDDAFELNSASDTQIFEFSLFRSNFLRLVYSHGSVSTGQIVMRSYGVTA